MRRSRILREVLRDVGVLLLGVDVLYGGLHAGCQHTPLYHAIAIAGFLLLLIGL